MSLATLPYEVVGIIVQDLDLEDVFHISLSSKRFLYLIRENRVCKAVLEVLDSHGTCPFPWPMLPGPCPPFPHDRWHGLLATGDRS